MDFAPRMAGWWRTPAPSLCRTAENYSVASKAHRVRPASNHLFRFLREAVQAGASANVHAAIDDRGRGENLLIQTADRQDLPVRIRAHRDHLALFARQEDFSVSRNW